MKDMDQTFRKFVSNQIDVIQVDDIIYIIPTPMYKDKDNLLYVSFIVKNDGGRRKKRDDSGGMFSTLLSISFIVDCII